MTLSKTFYAIHLKLNIFGDRYTSILVINDKAWLNYKDFVNGTYQIVITDEALQFSFTIRYNQIQQKIITKALI